MLTPARSHMHSFVQVREKVVSFVGREQLDIASWYDMTGDFSRLAHVSNFTRVKVVVTCIPEDEDAGGCDSWLLGAELQAAGRLFV